MTDIDISHRSTFWKLGYTFAGCYGSQRFEYVSYVMRRYGTYPP